MPSVNESPPNWFTEETGESPGLKRLPVSVPNLDGGRLFRGSREGAFPESGLYAVAVLIDRGAPSPISLGDGMVLHRHDGPWPGLIVHKLGVDIDLHVMLCRTQCKRWGDRRGEPMNP